MSSNLTDRINGVLSSLAVKAPCLYATTANITLSGLSTRAGGLWASALTAGNRILVMNQTDATENGIYDADSSDWSRSKDFDGNRDVVRGTRVPVVSSSGFTGVMYEVTTANPIVIGTSNINFTPASGDASGLSVTATGTTTSRLLADRYLDILSVTDNGANTNGTGNNSAAITASQADSDMIFFPDGTYLFTEEVTLTSNKTWLFSGNAQLEFDPDPGQLYAFDASGVANVTFDGLRLNGTGEAGYSLIRLVSSSDITFNRPVIKKAGANALELESCTRVKVLHGQLSNNYYYGVSDKDGTNNKYLDLLLYQNGSTGVATSVGGRGINLWRCIDCHINHCRFVANTEYGMRIYSEAADVTASYGNQILDNFFYDNVSSDIVLYDESLAGTKVYSNTFRSNRVIRTVAPTLGISVVMHGGDNSFSDNHVRKEGAFGAFVAFQFYYAVGTKFFGGSAYNVRDCFAFSSATGCVVDGFTGTTVGTGAGTAGIVGTDCAVRNSKFVHGGGGATDDCFVNYNATGKNFYENNYFDGFRRAIYIGDEAVALFRNTSVNSTSIGLRKDGNVMSGLECADNSWDSTTPWELSALRKTNSTYDRAITYYTAAPTGMTWAVGARCYNSAPAVGQPKSWVCTVAGTPGTWESEGNL